MAGSSVVMAHTRARNREGPRIRRMKKRDLPAVLELEREIYPQPWASSVFKDELSLLNRHYVVVEDEGTVLGYAGLLLVADDAHVTTIAIDPQARRRRLGSRLMLALIEAALAAGARHLTLEVRVSNAAARALYQQFGLAPVGVRKDYYRGEDALVMWATDIDGEEYRERLAAIRDGLDEDEI